MKRSTVTLVALMVVLLVVAYLVMQKPGEQSTSGAGELLVKIDSLAVDKFEIRSPKTRLVLEKKGVEWYLSEPVNFRAEQSNVANFIQLVKNLNVRSVVSNKPEKFPVFQVDTASGTMFTIYEKGELKASLIVGKTDATYTGLFVRKLPSSDVNSVDASISYQFTRPINDWRDKKIVSNLQPGINEVKYQYGDTAFTLQRKDSVWMIGKDPAKTEDVNSMLNTLSTNLMADDFIDSTISPAPKITGQITVPGMQVRFSYMKTPNKYYVQTSASPQWFMLDPWKANLILKRKKDLIKPAQ
jgi:hypothetical protein